MTTAAQNTNATEEWYDAELEATYNQMLIDLRSAIEARGTIADFVKEQAEQGQKFNQANLYRVFVRNQGQEMGLETYIRLCRILNVGGVRMRMMRVPKSNMTVLDYLYLDTDILTKSFTKLQYYDYAK